MASVRRQLIASLVLFAFVLGVLFATVTLLVFHRVEDRMVQRRLQQMLNDEKPGSEPVHLQFVGPVADAPQVFADRLAELAPGFHEWEAEDDSETHALVIEDSGTSSRRVAIARFSESEAAQSRFALALAVGVGVTSLLALMLARYLAVRTVSPIERLTERLATGPLDAVVPEDLAGEPRADEIGTLARALQRAGADLTASAERERRFLREASHELRTPITVIQGVSDLLRESIGPSDTITRQRLERLDRGLRRMNTSVLSLLAMARAEHRSTVGDVPSFRHQLDDMIDEAQAMAEPGVEVTYDVAAEPASGLAGSMLILALSNLTRNALQHAESPSVHITVDHEQAKVRDQGRGLPSELLEQLRSPGPKPDVGIGLATVQRICERFGWDFSIECPAPGGTAVEARAPGGTVATIKLSSEADGRFGRR